MVCESVLVVWFEAPLKPFKTTTIEFLHTLKLKQKLKFIYLSIFVNLQTFLVCSYIYKKGI